MATTKKTAAPSRAPASPLLGGLSPGEFLACHWQKRPLLVRGAVPGFGGIVDRDQLLALATREDATSRLVIQHARRKGGGSSTGRWERHDGPFGALDTGNYDQIRIVRLNHDSVRGFISLQIEYGRTINSVWTPGFAPAGKQTNFHIDGQAYTDLVTDSEPLDANEKTYDAVRRGLFEWLSANNHIAAGSIV